MRRPCSPLAEEAGAGEQERELVALAGAVRVASQAVVQALAELAVRVLAVLLLEQAQELPVPVALRVEARQQDQAPVLERRAGVGRAQERLAHQEQAVVARQAMEAVA